MARFKLTPTRALEMTARMRQHPVDPTAAKRKPLDGLYTGTFVALMLVIIGRFIPNLSFILTGNAYVGQELVSGSLAVLGQALTIVMGASIWRLASIPRQAPTVPFRLWLEVAASFIAAHLFVMSCLHLAVYLFFKLPVALPEFIPVETLMVLMPALASAAPVAATALMALRKSKKSGTGLFDLMHRCLCTVHPYLDGKSDVECVQEPGTFKLRAALHTGEELVVEGSTAPRAAVEKISLYPVLRTTIGHGPVVPDKHILEPPVGGVAGLVQHHLEASRRLEEIIARAGVPPSRRPPADTHTRRLGLHHNHGLATPFKDRSRASARTLRAVPHPLPKPRLIDPLKLLSWVWKVGIPLVFVVIISHAETVSWLEVALNGGFDVPTQSSTISACAMVLTAWVISLCLWLVERRFWPRAAPKHKEHSIALVLEDDQLSMTHQRERTIDIGRPFGIALTRSPSAEGRQPCVSVRLSQTTDEGQLAWLTFNVGAQDGEVLEELDELDVHAPLIHPDDLESWVWPQLLLRAQLHGVEVPVSFTAPAGLKVAQSAAAAVEVVSEQ